MGQHRYLLTVPGVASASDLPDGWGLLLFNGTRIKRAVSAGWNWHRDERNEQVLLVAELRRMAGGKSPTRTNGLVLDGEPDGT